MSSPEASREKDGEGRDDKNDHQPLKQSRSLTSLELPEKKRWEQLIVTSEGAIGGRTIMASSGKAKVIENDASFQGLRARADRAVRKVRCNAVLWRSIQ
jgi:hypothetical protein